MRAITRGVDLNALRSLLGFLILTIGVAIAADRAWEGPEGRFGFCLMVEGEVVEGQFDRFVVVPHVDTSGLPRGFDVAVDLRRVTTGDTDRGGSRVGRMRRTMAGGALTVRDAVDVDFLIVAGNSGRSM